MKQQLTKSDIEKIEAEIEERKLIKRKELIEAVKEARAQGDLSENFEYYAAKREKNINESRIRYLERILKTAEIIDDSSNAGEVGINNRITVEFLDDGDQETYKLVTSMRSSSLKNLVSIESPIGKALIGHKEGDIVTVNVDNNISYELKIIKIDESCDDSNDKLRKF